MINNNKFLTYFHLKVFIIFIHLWFELSTIRCNTITGLKVFSFNAKPVLRDHDDSENDTIKENFVDIQIKEGYEPLENLSYCFRINLRDLFVQCVFSEDDLQFIFMDESSLCGFLYYHGIYYMFKFPENLHHVAPEEWHHVCVSYQTIFRQKEKAEIRMYLDGIKITHKIIDTPPNIDTRFQVGRSWRIGYCKKDHLINNVRYTRGNITDFNVWSTALSDDEMKSFTTSWKLEQMLDFKTRSPDIINWRKMKIVKQGRMIDTFIMKPSKNCMKDLLSQNGERLDHNNDSQCKTDQNEMILTFAKRLTFHEIALTCQQLGGELFLPKQMEDIDTMLSMARWDNQTSQTCPSIWLPIFEVGKKNSSYKHFKYHKQTKVDELELVEYLNWQFGHPNGQGNLN